MANQVLITKRLTNDGWIITGKLSSTSTVPKDIFVYENTGTNQLGTYTSVVSIQDIARIVVWAGTPIQVNRNKYVRYSDLKIVVPRDEDVDKVIDYVVASTKQFVKDFNSVRESTKTYVID